MPAQLKHPPPPQWRVNLRARSRNFRVEVRAATPIPTWRPPGHHRVSVLLRLWSFVLLLQSGCWAEPPRPPRRSLGSRFLGALERVRGFRAKKRAAATREADKIGIVRLSLVPVLISAFLLGAVTARRLDKIGAAVAAAAPTILGRWSKEFFAWQGSFAAAAAAAAAVVLVLLTVVRSWSRAIDLVKQADFAGDWARGILWKIWRSARQLEILDHSIYFEL
ncbi:hypothetical protein ACJRO7_000732 [Eucalyptus globulus]|uniref:ABC transmembrane type-1 domain-containing protein n=1 Tax=Eucalyptus globulus TaxID=34317 RepID=A0ABD3LTW5_EUCGL